MPTATRKQKIQHKAQTCLADRQETRKDVSAILPTWELYSGIIQLVIIGPGDNQWYPVSHVNYGGPVGTPEERMIATLAVAYLNEHHPSANNVTKSTITAILKESALGVTTL